MVYLNVRHMHVKEEGGWGGWNFILVVLIHFSLFYREA